MYASPRRVLSVLQMEDLAQKLKRLRRPFQRSFERVVCLKGCQRLLLERRASKVSMLLETAPEDSVSCCGCAHPGLDGLILVGAGDTGSMK
jgi:hypothetical protein